LKLLRLLAAPIVAQDFMAWEAAAVTRAAAEAGVALAAAQAVAVALVAVGKANKL
jgi:hypothetical protein